MVKHTRRALVSFAVLSLLIAVVLPILSPFAPQAAAASTDNLCVPDPKGFSVNIINRAELSLSYTPQGHCMNNSNSDQYLLGSVKFTDIFNSSNIYVDGNTGDGNMEYDGDLGAFNNFNGSVPTDPTGGRDERLSTSAIQQLFNNQVHFGFLVPEKKVNLGVCKDLYVLQGDVDKPQDMKWNCFGMDHLKAATLTLPNADVTGWDNFNIVYTASSTGTAITHVSSGQQKWRSFTWCDNTSNFVSTDGKAQCAGDMQIDASQDYISSLGSGTGQITIKNSSGKTVDAVVAGSDSPAAANAQNCSGSDCTDDSNAPSCESTGGALSWITCKVIDGISGLEKSIEGLISSLLQTKTFEFNCTTSDASCSTSQKIYKVWSNFRVYGDIILVIALLVVVFGEAVGGGVIDAYTARKILPRILAAAILINLSIYIVAALEDVVNILGQGIYGILNDPFSSANATINIKGAQGAIFSIGGSVGLLGAIGAGGLLWHFGGIAALGDAAGFFALMIGLPVLMAIIGVILTIFFRQVILIFLVFISPLAFALWCLPNTEQYFKKWWSFLFKTLLVYPVVMTIFAMCSVGAVVLSSFGITGSDWIGELMSILAVAAPLFLVPFAFKISGGVIGQIHEAVSGLGKRATQGIQGDAKDPNSLQSKVRRRFANRRGEAGLNREGVTVAAGSVFNPFSQRRVYTRKGRERLHEALGDHRQAARVKGGAAYLESDPIWQANKEDSKFLLAHANRELALQRMNAATGDEKEQWKRAISTSDLVHRDRSTQLASAQAWLATGYDLNPDGQQAYNEMAETLGGLTGATLRRDAVGNIIGFEGANAGAAVDAMNTAQASMVRNGQFHLAGINYGTGYDPDRGLGKADPYTWGRSKPDSAKGAGDSAIAHVAKGTSDDLKKASVYKQELRAIAQSATGAQRDAALKEYARLTDTSTSNPDAASAAAISTWEQAQVVAPGGGPVKISYVERFRAEDFAGATRAAQEADALTKGWTANDISRGERIVTRNKTNADSASEEARISRIPREDET